MKSDRCRRSSRRWIRIWTSEVGGSDEDWTARVVQTDTAAKEFSEVSVVKVSGGAAWVFEGRKSLPLTVI